MEEEMKKKIEELSKLDKREKKIIDMAFLQEVGQEILGVFQKYKLNEEEQKYILEFLLDMVKMLIEDEKKKVLMMTKMSVLGKEIEDKLKKRDL